MKFLRSDRKTKEGEEWKRKMDVLRQTGTAGPLIWALATVSWMSAGRSPLVSLPLVFIAVAIGLRSHIALSMHPDSNSSTSPIASGVKFRAQSLASRTVSTLVSALFENLKKLTVAYHFRSTPDTASFPKQEAPFPIPGLCP